MTVGIRDLTKMPSDTAAIGQKVMAASNPYRVIGDHLPDILRDELFVDMYEPTGRRAVSPSLLAMVTIFQFQEKVPDREAAQMVATRIDWKYALHLPLDYAGFDYCDLCYFRGRLLEHDQQALVFDTILKKIKELGFIKKGGKQRTDSIAVLGAVRLLSILETVSETLRVTVRALEKADKNWAEKTLPASFREQYGRMCSDYRLTAGERKAALQQVGEDGFWLLDQIDGSGSEGVKTLEEVEVFRSVWGQRYERIDGGAKQREKVVCNSKDLILTPHDSGVCLGEKRGKRWIGEKAHVTETAERGGPNFITDITTANASSGDLESLPEIRENFDKREVKPSEQYVDSGYVSGKQLAESEKAGIKLMGPPLEDHSHDGFKIPDFRIDREAKQATCPGERTSVKWVQRTERDGSASIHIQFRKEDCEECPLRGQCTTSKTGRSISLSEHYERLEIRRAEAKSEDFKEQMKARPAIEGTLSELVRGYGFRQHRYRGDGKRNFENMLKGAACNLMRLARALVPQKKKSAAKPKWIVRGTVAPVSTL